MNKFVAIKINSELSAEKIILSVQKLIGSKNDLEDAVIVISLKTPLDAVENG